MTFWITQALNGISFGMLLFLLAAGLTLIFGIMDLVNLAHGSLYMIGAYFAATFAAWTDSFIAGHGPGITTLMSSAGGKIQPRMAPDVANLATVLRLR